MRNQKEKDRFFMRMALDLALKGRGKTSPNPMVGAVIVKNNRVIAKDYHKKAGLPHAEVYALREAGRKAKGATLYVTLEPCNTSGRTPPCAPAISAAGIVRVVVASRDSNPLNKNKGIRYLKGKGIQVKTGVLRKEEQRVNEIYHKFNATGLPWVTVKVAMSLDGKIATKTGDSHWISCGQSRMRVRKLRNEVGAIIIGKNTCWHDNPCLYSGGKDFYRVVLASGAQLDPRARIFGMPRVLVAVTDKASKKKIAYLSGKGARVEVLPEDINGRVNLKALVRRLTLLGVRHVLIEGGGETIAAAFRGDLVDSLYCFIAPKIIGGREAPTPVDGLGIKKVKEALWLERMETVIIGSDLLVKGYVHRNNN